MVDIFVTAFFIVSWIIFVMNIAALVLDIKEKSPDWIRTIAFFGVVASIVSLFY